MKKEFNKLYDNTDLDNKKLPSSLLGKISNQHMRALNQIWLNVLASEILNVKGYNNIGDVLQGLIIYRIFK